MAELDFPKDDLDKKFDMEKRQHLWCICKVILINTIKLSECNNVRNIFKLEGNILKYNIKDDGVGFDKQEKKGNGLEIIAFRANILHAKYEY